MVVFKLRVIRDKNIQSMRKALAASDPQAAYTQTDKCWNDYTKVLPKFIHGSLILRSASARGHVPNTEYSHFGGTVVSCLKDREQNRVDFTAVAIV